MRTLIAEDDLTSRLMLEALIKSWGHEVISARDGDEAWQLLSEPDAPQLAILDWMMPGMDGPDVCKRVREELQGEERYVYVILLTSRASKEDIADGMAAEVDDYVVKPFHARELLGRVQAGLRILELHNELVATKRRLHALATYDALTHTLNRRVVLERLEAELSRGAREQREISVGLLDIDFFKRVNDTYGHPAGDAVLRECARRLRASVRPYDSVGRWGGEEFLLVLPGLRRADTPVVFERLRSVIAAPAMEAGSELIGITISAGVATARLGQDAQEIVNVVDEALYAAKRNGRNRVEFA